MISAVLFAVLVAMLLLFQSICYRSLRQVGGVVQEQRNWLDRYRHLVRATLVDGDTDYRSEVPPSPTLQATHRIPALLRVPVRVDRDDLPLRRLCLPSGCSIVGVMRSGEVLLVQDCPLVRCGDEILAVALMPRYAPLLRSALEKSFAGGPTR